MRGTGRVLRSARKMREKVQTGEETTRDEIRLEFYPAIYEIVAREEQLRSG